MQSRKKSEVVKRIFDIKTDYNKVLNQLILAARDLAVKERNRIESIEGRLQHSPWERLPKMSKKKVLTNWDIMIQVLDNQKITQIAKEFGASRHRIYRIITDYSMKLWHLYRAVKDEEEYLWIEELRQPPSLSLFEEVEGRVVS